MRPLPHTYARLGAALLGLAVMATGVIAPVLAAGTPLYPDLGVLPPRDLQLDRTDVSEDGSGVIHNVLRFSNAAINKGEGALELRGTIDPATGRGPAVQRVWDTAGGFTDYPVGTLYFHGIHDHYHFEGWGLYQLWAKADYDKWVASGRTQGQAKKTGTKTTSCVLDEEFIEALPGTPWPGRYGSAGCRLNAQNQLLEGLSPGWGDTYDYYRYEQWIDLGNETLTDGEWVLRSITDASNILYESAGKADATRESVLDNEAITTFSVSGGRLVDSNAPSGSVSINRIDATTASASVTVQVLGRDDVSGVRNVRLSNDGVTWATYTYSAPGPSTAQAIPWSLTDARFGGTTATGTKTVYGQFQDASGRWSPSITDTIVLQPLTGYAATIMADAPVSYWRLGETSGTGAADVTGRNPGTYEGSPALGAASLLAADPADRSLAVDGVNDNVMVPDSATLDVSSALSLEAWIRPSSLPATGAFASILAKPESYALQFNGPQLEFTLMQAGVRRRLQAPAGAVVAGSTYHVVGTFDGTTQRLFLNGVQVASAALSGVATVTTNPVRIASWNGSREYLAGRVDDVAVYGTALTASRVGAHWTAGGAGTAPAPTATPSQTPSPTATPAPSAWASAVLADAPVSWWRFGEDEGTTARDEMATNNGAYWNSPLLQQPSLVASDAHPSLRLNGTSQYISVPGSSSLNLGSALTLEAWIRPTSLPAAGSFETVIAKRESYAIQFNGPQLELTIIQSGVRRRLQAPAGAIVAGATSHVVATYDGATQRLYVNGTLVASAALTGAATTTTDPLRIGSWNGTAEFMAGGIDEVAVYGTALSAARVQAHWTAGGGTGGGTSPTPSPAPTAAPTASPTPSGSPTPAPTATPTTAPTAPPTASPAPTPTPKPAPTKKPRPRPTP